MLRAGFAVTCITPPLGKDIPGLFERRFAEGVHDPLYARAIALDDGRCRAALVQVDSIFVRDELVAAARREAQRLCGISGRNCLIAATHTHSGGPVFRGFQSENDPEYDAYLVAQIGSAIAEAFRRRRPTHTASGRGKAEDVAFNRRFVMRDGTQRTHPGKMHPDIEGPAGPEDPTVTVLAFRDPDTEEPFGCIVNFACHGTHMNGVLYSADYPKWIVDSLQAVYGREFGVVYLNGACGDVTQVDNRSPRPMEMGAPWCKRTGRVVGGEALKVLARMAYRAATTVDAASRTITIPIRKSAPQAIRAARAYLSRNPRGAPVARSVFAGDLLQAERALTGQQASAPVDTEAIFARELLEVEALRRKTPVLQLEIQGIRVGDTLFWGVPAELFQALALDVRDRSPFAHTCCVELANGYAGYICTPEAFAGGGYEVRTARSSLLTEEAGAKVVRAALSVARTLHRRDIDGERLRSGV